MNRTERLEKLVRLQRQVKALHETRHAMFKAQSIAAETEARELVERFDDEGSLSGLFPELYNNRIASALTRREGSEMLARGEVAQIAEATARSNMVERAYRDALRKEERENEDRERLEIVERGAFDDG